MDRNYEFEMEYLIGLVAAIIGASSIRPLQQFVVSELSFALILVIVAHVVLLTGVYSFRRGTEVEINITRSFEQISKGTLWLSTMLFLAFFIGLITNFFLPNWIVQPVIAVISGVFSISDSQLGLAVGVILTILIGGIFYRKYFPAIRASKNIDVAFAPLEVRTGRSYETSKPIRVTVTNYSELELDFWVSLKFPEDISWKYQGRDDESEDSGEFEDEFTLGPDKVKPINLQVRYRGEQNTKLRIPVDAVVDYRYGKFEEQIHLDVNTY